MKNLLKEIVRVLITLEARWVLAKYRPNVIGITGSVGKTSTKDLVYSVVSKSFPTRKSQKSFNSEFGVPLTILDLPNAWQDPIGWVVNIFRGLILVLLPNTYPKWLVLEVGADHPGDVRKLASWLSPRIALITGFGSETPVHMEFFPSIAALVKEKGELLRALDSVDSAIINRDDERAWEMRAITDAHILSFGFGKSAQVRGDNLNVMYTENGKPKGQSLRVDYKEKSLPIRLHGVLGKGHAYAALAGFATGTRLGINLVTISEAISSHLFAPGRMRILDGVRDTTLIDDTYNSSPGAVKMALDTLHDLENGRKIAVLGDMLELGEYSQSEHKKVGTWMRGVVDILVCVGERARQIGQSAMEDGFEKENIHYFANSHEAAKFMKDFVQTKDLILVKGSQSIRLERVTEALLADPSKAEELLVRQEKEWKSKT